MKDQRLAFVDVVQQKYAGFDRGDHPVKVRRAFDASPSQFQPELVAIGEGASRARSADVAAIETYLRSDKFDLAAFKGQKVTFRKWDGQMRQPIIIADAELPVSTSPQQGFLHQHAEIDTLGIDEPESLCHF